MEASPMEFVKEAIVEGVWLEQDLKDKYKEEGGLFNLISLVKRTVAIDYDEERDVVMVSGERPFFFTVDIKESMVDTCTFSMDTQSQF
jgi:hypothetical protein